MGETVAFVIPLRTSTGAGNSREHWMRKYLRAEAEKASVRRHWPASFDLTLPVTVRLQRVSPGKADADNAIAGLKHVQDEIATQLGVDDGDEGWVLFEYDRPARGAWAVNVEIRQRPGTERRVAERKETRCAACASAVEAMISGRGREGEHCRRAQQGCRCFCRPARAAKKPARRVRSPAGETVDLLRRAGVKLHLSGCQRVQGGYRCLPGCPSAGWTGGARAR